VSSLFVKFTRASTSARRHAIAAIPVPPSDAGQTDFQPSVMGQPISLQIFAHEHLAPDKGALMASQEQEFIFKVAVMGC
jgi:hypothetical protein